MAKRTGTLARVHGWLAVVAGVALLSWIVSALGMLLPWGIQPFEPAPIPFEAVAVSPAELAARLGPEAALSEVTLRVVDGTPVYAVRRGGQPIRRFDARTGEPFELSLERAEQIVRRITGGTTPVLRLERHEAYTKGYVWGPLPVAQVVFSDEPSVYWFVDPEGKVRQSAPINRLQQFFNGLHRFEPVKAYLGEARQRASMILLALLALTAVASGYLLAFSRRLWRRRKPGAAPEP